MAGSKSGKGPKNILNDLDFKTWLRFQKSFDRYDFGNDGFPTELGDIARNFVRFFSKHTIDYHPSSILTNLSLMQDADGRNIVKIEGDPLYPEWQRHAESGDDGFYDYAFLKTEGIADASHSDVDNFFQFLSRNLKDHSYGTVLARDGKEEYPYVWSFATACRRYLLLCDEKVFLDSQSICAPVYALQFRKQEEKLPQTRFKTNIKTTHIDRIPTYIIPRPAPRKKHEFKHPAKFPEELIDQLIVTFTKESDWVLDVMAGTGSALISAHRNRRNSVGIELNHEFYDIAKKRMYEANPVRLPGFESPFTSELILGDARNVAALLAEKKGDIKYCITSPPYWDMLHNPGSEGQRSRKQKGLQLVYSESEHDLGNITDYYVFLSALKEVFNSVAKVLSDDGKLTIITKNVKRNGSFYTLAWDLVEQLAGSEGSYNFLGYTLWCQDDAGLKPFAIGHHWVSNTLHQYCLHFSKSV